jgi:uncharacterized membrane protein
MLGRKKPANKKGRSSSKWFAMKPAALVVTIVYLLALMIAPLLRGESLRSASVAEVLVTLTLTMSSALLVAWMAWRLWHRRDGVANVAFCLVVIVVGVWTIALDASQRNDATAMAMDSLDRQVNALREKAIDALE